MHFVIVAIPKLNSSLNFIHSPFYVSTANGAAKITEWHGTLHSTAKGLMESEACEKVARDLG